MDAVAARGRRSGQRWLVSLVLSGAIALTTLAGAVAIHAVTGRSVSKTARITADYASLPLAFTRAQGQAAPGIDFIAGDAGTRLDLSATGAISALHGANVSMQLAGADPAAIPETYASLPGRVSYIIGADPSRWATNLATFSRVGYHDVYPGIDIAYHGNQQRLEYDFTVAPGANPAAIVLAFPSATAVSIDREGNLQLHTPSGTVTQLAPHIYQQSGTTQRTITGGFVLRDSTHVGFSVGAYDHSLPLVIDPTIVFSTYLGGTGNEEGGYDIAVDSANDAYVAGGTALPGQGHGSVDFPTTSSAFQKVPGGDNDAGDAYVSKLSADGTTLLYSTYIGGRGFDDSGGLVVDAAGHAYVRGVTNSPDFPTTSHAFQIQQAGASFNVWVAELSTDGSSLLYSTYLGGHGFNSGTGLAVDGSGSAYVTGLTGAPDFPTTEGALDRNFHGKTNFAPPPFSTRPDDYDAFVTKLSPNGKHLEYSTFLGGNRLDAGFAITVDSQGNAFVAGDTRSPSFPATPHALDKAFNGQTDAFVAELNPSGSGLVYATYLGGSGFDEGIGIAVDSADNAYVTGSTASADFPTTPGAYQTTFASTLASPPQPCTPIAPPPCGPRNAYVAKISAGGSSLLYSTFIGGSVFDFGTSIAIDAAGDASITGGTLSPDFPTTSGAPQTALGGNQDAIVSELSPDGSTLVMSTFLGGLNFDQGQSIALGPDGDAYVTGATSSTNYPVTSGAFQQTLKGAANGFVTRLHAMHRAPPQTLQP